MTTEEQINLLNERLVKGEITVEEHSQILEIIKKQDPNPTEAVEKGEPEPEKLSESKTSETSSGHCDETDEKKSPKPDNSGTQSILDKPLRWLWPGHRRSTAHLLNEDDPKPENLTKDKPTEKSTTSSNEKSFKQLAKYSGIQLWVIVTITLCSPWLWEEKSLPAFLGMLIASTLPIWMVGVVVNFIGWQICVSFLFPTSKTYKIITGIIIVATILLNPFRSYINERAEEKLQEIIQQQYGDNEIVEYHRGRFPDDKRTDVQLSVHYITKFGKDWAETEGKELPKFYRDYRYHRYGETDLFLRQDE